MGVAFHQFAVECGKCCGEIDDEKRTSIIIDGANGGRISRQDISRVSYSKNIMSDRSHDSAAGDKLN